MSAPSYYVEPHYSEKLYKQALHLELNATEPTGDDLIGLELDFSDALDLQVGAIKPTTDLVRLYLQDIGRVRLLTRDEEVSEAQNIQRYMQLLELRDQAASQQEGAICRYVHLINAHDRLTAQLGHRPSLERWAAEAEVTVADLKPTLAEGKRQWAMLAGITSQDLEAIQNEGLRAKDHMIKANLRLVVSVAKKYQNRGMELLDLIQEGTLGLERAVEKFDPTKGYRFSTYAYWWIRQGITRAIASQSRTVRLPVHMVEKLNQVRKARQQLSQELGRKPTKQELAKALELDEDKLDQVLDVSQGTLSLHAWVGREEDTELMQLIEDADGVAPNEHLDHKLLCDRLNSVLDHLSDRERDIIKLRFGLTDGQHYTLSEIGELYHLSRERVRQIQAKAMRKLRHPRRQALLRDWMR